MSARAERGEGRGWWRARGSAEAPAGGRAHPVSAAHAAEQQTVKCSLVTMTPEALAESRSNMVQYRERSCAEASSGALLSHEPARACLGEGEARRTGFAGRQRPLTPTLSGPPNGKVAAVSVRGTLIAFPRCSGSAAGWGEDERCVGLTKLTGTKPQAPDPERAGARSKKDGCRPRPNPVDTHASPSRWGAPGLCVLLLVSPG